MHLVCLVCSATNCIPNDHVIDHASNTPVCGRCRKALIATDPLTISDQALPRFLSHSEFPILIAFWAEDCSSCKAMAPQFEAAAKQAPQIFFVKVNSDTAPVANQQFGIRSIPTSLLFQGGREIGRQSGVMPAAQLLAWADSLLADS